jgi:hypothetical protein
MFAPPPQYASAPIATAITPPNYGDPTEVARALSTMRAQGAQTQGQQLQNQIAQQQLRDQQLVQQYFAQRGAQTANPNAAGAGGAMPGPSGPGTNNPTLAPNGQPYPVLPGGLIDRTGTPAPPAQGAPPAQSPMAPLAGQPAAVTAMQQRPAALPGAGQNPIVGMDLGELARNGVSGGMLQSLAGSQLKYAADYQNLTKGAQEIKDKNNAYAASALKGLYYSDPETWAQNYAGVRDAVRKLAPDDPATMPDQLPANPAQAKNLLAMHMGFLDAHESIVASAKSAAETEKALNESANAAAETPGKEAQSRILQNQAGAIDAWRQGLSAGNDAGPAMIQRAIAFNPQAAQGFLDRYNVAMHNGDYKASQDVLTEATKYGVENNPTTRAQAATQAATVAGQEAAARAPSEIHVAGANAATQNALEQQRTARGKDYDAGQDYASTMGLVNSALAAVQQARAGGGVQSEAAQALIPAATLALAGIKRLPAVAGEIGKGGMQDRAISALDNAFHNRPTDENALNEAEQWLKTLGNNAADTKNGTADSLKRAFPGQRVERIDRPFPQTATGPNGHKIVSTDGKTWKDAKTGAPVQ